jgi:triacylglycerol lipase
MNEYMDKDLLNKHRNEFYGPKKRCTRCFGKDEVPPSLAYRDISSFFENGDSFLYKFREMLDHISVMGRRGAPKFPMFIYQGTNDKIVDPIEVANNLVRDLCEKGTNVRYRQFPDLNHMQTLVVGAPYVWSWIANVLDGWPTVPGCRERDLNPRIGRSEDGLLSEMDEDLVREYSLLASQIPVRNELR